VQGWERVTRTVEGVAAEQREQKSQHYREPNLADGGVRCDGGVGEVGGDEDDGLQGDLRSGGHEFRANVVSANLQVVK